MFTLLVNIFFRPRQFAICVSGFAHGLWKWFNMFLTLFTRITYVGVVQWKVRLYYYGLQVNGSIYLILVLDAYPITFTMQSTTCPLYIHSAMVIPLYHYTHIALCSLCFDQLGFWYYEDLDLYNLVIWYSLLKWHETGRGLCFKQ